VTAALEAYRFDDAANRLYQFVWGSFCDWYLEFSKPILQGADAAAGSETRATIGWALAQIVHLLHPIMPYVTEEIWAQLGGDNAGLLLTAKWPELAPDLHDPDSAAEMEALIEDLSKIRAARNEYNLPPSQRIEAKVIDPTADALTRIQRYDQHFSRLAGIKLTGVEAKASAGTIGIAFSSGGATTSQVVGSGVTYSLQIGDLRQERERLTKEIEKHDVELAKLRARLANPGFLSKAKPELIEEQREREANLNRDRDRLQAAYERLEAV
jgi:valyl-tRNA synthetase